MNNHRRLLASTGLVAGLVLGWAVGCGSSDSGSRATLGPAGGTLSVPGTGVELAVPAGALSSPVDVAVKTRRDAAALTVALEPADLRLARPATLSVTVAGPAHFSSVTESSSGTPMGLDARTESASSATARLRLDRFKQVRFALETVADGGVAPGACREDDDGEAHDGEHEGDEEGDGGHHRDDAGTPTGSATSMACPTGFECDDGVCVAPGGNDEHHDACDGGPCHGDDDEQCDGGACRDDDGDCDGGACHEDGPHDGGR
ncbi:MAG TPA: hypothetical protein VLT82_07850 [Myxococcaceae bacterium]|nr:hypothetical protein [Myxococcaceae bacterium]